MTILKFVSSTCPTPTNLSFSNVTPNSVVLDWVPGNNVSSWIVNYNGNLVSTSTIPYTLSNLVADSTYNIFVTGLCANNDTAILLIQSLLQLHVLTELRPLKILMPLSLYVGLRNQ